jgi:hypothetical protein
VGRGCYAHTLFLPGLYSPSCPYSPTVLEGRGSRKLAFLTLEDAPNFGGCHHVYGGKGWHPPGKRVGKEVGKMSLSPFGRRGVAEADQMGAEAVIGVDVDHESIQIGQGGSMLMVSASGTAVKL